MLPDSFAFRTNDTILSVNPGHDGTIVALKDGRLLFSYEAEQDCHSRHMPAGACFLLNVMSALRESPAVIARSGWHRDYVLSYESQGVPYHGIEETLVRQKVEIMLGRPTLLFESTHERAHIFGAFGMSPFPQGQPFYALVWEGEIGSFFEVDASMSITRYGPVVTFPGYKSHFSSTSRIRRCRREAGAWIPPGSSWLWPASRGVASPRPKSAGL